MDILRFRSPLKPLARAMFLTTTVITTLVTTSLLVAAPANAQPAAAQHYEITPGTLDQALSRFAAQAGILLAIDGALTVGKSSTGLRGDYSVEAGLQQLLANSGLRAVRKADGSFALERVAGAETTLKTVAVSDSLLGQTTERTGSYTTGQMRSATKLPLSIRQTPQSVTVITSARIKDENLVDLVDVVDTTPGLIVSYAAIRPGFQSRGFAIDRITQDGIPSIHDDYIPSALGNMAMQDRVEVIRGASGLMQGAGNPSGAINLIRKRPTRDFQLDLQAGLGSWDDYRASGDVSGALSADGRIRGRAVAAVQDAKNFRDIEEDDNGLGYFTVDFDLGEHTTLNLAYSYLDTHTNMVWGGIPVGYDGHHLDVPRSTFVGADWEYVDNKARTIYLGVDHDFGNGWQFQLNAAYVKSTTDSLSTHVVPTELEGGYGHVWWAANKDSEQKAVDLFVSGPFSLFSRTHELVFGGAVSREESASEEWFDSWDSQITSGINFRDWNHQVQRPDTSADSPYRYDYETLSDQDSVYTAARFSIAEPLTLIVGLRLDWYERTALWGGDGYKVDGNVTQYGGLVYDLDTRHSIYVSYSDVFQPQDALGTNGDFIDPIVGENYEIGVKGEYFGGALNTSAAIFRIDQTNRAVELDDQSDCPTFPAVSCSKAAGLVRSEGFDLEAQGQLAAGWNVGGGLTWSRAEYKKDSDPANVGERLDTGVPTTQFKLTTRYKLPGELSAFTVGGRLTWQSKVYSDVPLLDDSVVRNQQDAYSLLDLDLTYAVSQALSLQLEVNNVFDKTYYRNISQGDFYYSGAELYGEPRNVLLNLRYSL